MEVGRIISDLVMVKGSLLRGISIVDGKTDRLVGAVCDARRDKDDGVVDVDGLVYSDDVNIQKYIKTISLIHASDDVLYNIDEAIIQGVVGVEEGMRMGRKVSRGMFEGKYWVEKCGREVVGGGFRLR